MAHGQDVFVANLKHSLWVDAMPGFVGVSLPLAGVAATLTRFFSCLAAPCVFLNMYFIMVTRYGLVQVPCETRGTTLAGAPFWVLS